MRQLLSILLFFFFIGSLLSQEEERKENFFGLGFNYGIDFAAGELSDRFGQNFHAGLSLELFKSKLNGVLRFEGLLFFGDNVREDVISKYRTTSGAILGNNGEYADVFLRERGVYLGILANKIVIPSKKNSHSGLALGLGLGVLQHNIRLQVDTENAPQFSNDYAKGYDRHTIGPALKQNISFLHIGKNKAINYEIALSIIEGLTQNSRAIDFDLGTKPEGRRMDILIGLDIKWILPIKDQQEPGEIYY